MARRLKDWLREPLVHFLAVGISLFALHAVLSDGGPADTSNLRIEVAAAEIEWLARNWEARWQRPLAFAGHLNALRQARRAVDRLPEASRRRLSGTRLESPHGEARTGPRDVIRTTLEGGDKQWCQHSQRRCPTVSAESLKSALTSAGERWPPSLGAGGPRCFAPPRRRSV